MKNPGLLLMIFLTVAFLYSCGGGKKEPEIVTKPAVIIKKDSSTHPLQAPIINIIDTIALKYLVVYMKDSAATSEGISEKLSKIYSKSIPEMLAKANIVTNGPPIAWYKNTSAPFFFEAGIPVEKKPANLPKGFYVKNIGGDSAVIAHFYGPYSITNMGYDALSDWAKDNKKRKNGAPYEIYVSEPLDEKGKAIDPYRLRTDIVFPHK